MDRNYYYRVLGVRSDATPAQIKAAYNARMARLSSADYDDEPEYAKRKKEQATKAYRVLMGVAPSATKEQKESRFEKLKDKIERREGFDIDDEAPKIKFSMPKLDLGRKAVATTADKAKLTVAGTFITIVIAVIGLVSSFADLVADDDYNYIYEDIYYIEEIQNAEETTWDFDFYEGLDTSTVNENRMDIVWFEGVDQYVDEFGEISALRSELLDVIYSFDIYDEEEFYHYVTDDLYYYVNCDDYDCAITLINWLGAPDFSDIAGATSYYSGEQILSMTDYMQFLEDYCYDNY